MKIGVITLTYNEIRIVNFFIQHYLQIVDQLVFFDGGSTDGTREAIKSCPNAILMEHDTGGKIDDISNIEIKNTAYKSFTDWTWAIVVDADEFLYHPHLRFFVALMDDAGFNAVQCQAWQMMGDAMPTLDRPITEQIQWGVRDEYTKTWFDKVCLFKKEVDIRYETGAHTQHSPNIKLARGKLVQLLHYKWLCREDVERKAQTVKLSDANLHFRLGLEPDTDIPSPDFWVKRYDMMLKQRVKVL